MRKTSVMLLLSGIALFLISGVAFSANKQTAAKKNQTTNTVPAQKKPESSTTTTTQQTNQTTTQSNELPAGVTEEILQLLRNPQNPQAGEKIDWDVIASGGGSMSSTNYILDGTVGQPVAGPSTSTNYALNAGFWQNFGGPAYICGDIDDNGRVDIGDAVFLVNYIFAGGAAPDPLASGDVDCTARVDITDAVYIISYIFGGGPSPCAAC